MEELPDFTEPGVFLLLTTILFIIVVSRYFLIAGIFQLWFYIWKKEKWIHRRLGKKEVDKNQYYREIKWSMITSLIFALAGSVTMMRHYSS
jgi:hypothetical protein